MPTIPEILARRNDIANLIGDPLRQFGVMPGVFTHTHLNLVMPSDSTPTFRTLNTFEREVIKKKKDRGTLHSALNSTVKVAITEQGPFTIAAIAAVSSSDVYIFQGVAKRFTGAYLPVGSQRLPHDPYVVGWVDADEPNPELAARVAFARALDNASQITPEG